METLPNKSNSFSCLLIVLSWACGVSDVALTQRNLAGTSSSGKIGNCLKCFLLVNNKEKAELQIGTATVASQSLLMSFPLFL